MCSIDLSPESLWPCVDYGRVRDSSLQLGVSMSWLLEPSWSQAWADRDNTFCDSFYRNPQTLEHFLKFTQVLFGFIKSSWRHFRRRSICFSIAQLV